MVSTRVKMTIEEASALRVILKFELVGKTGELFKDLTNVNVTALLNTVVRNAEVWSRLDNAISMAMLLAYKERQLAMTIQDEVVVELAPGMIDTIQGILKNGTYIQTLGTANSNKQMQTSMGAMIPVAIVDKNIERIHTLFEIAEESPMVFFPMKPVEGRQ